MCTRARLYVRATFVYERFVACVYVSFICGGRMCLCARLRACGRIRKAAYARVRVSVADRRSNVAHAVALFADARTRA